METNITRQYISSEVRFYTISDLAKMLGWGEPTVQTLFKIMVHLVKTQN